MDSPSATRAAPPVRVEPLPAWPRTERSAVPDQVARLVHRDHPRAPCPDRSAWSAHRALRIPTERQRRSLVSFKPPAAVDLPYYQLPATSYQLPAREEVVARRVAPRAPGQR